MELNAEQVKNEIQSIIKALKDCGGWVKRGNGEGWFNHEILADALALISSQDQKIKELTENNKKLSAQNYMLCPDGTIAMIPTVKSVRTDTVQEVIASIDEMFRRQRYESMWIGKNGAVLGRVDIGDAQECWDGYIKPEIERMLEEGK